MEMCLIVLSMFSESDGSQHYDADINDGAVSSSVTWLPSTREHVL